MNFFEPLWVGGGHVLTLVDNVLESAWPKIVMTNRVLWDHIKELIERCAF